MTEKKLVILICRMFSFAFILQLSLVNIMCSGYDEIAYKQSVKSIDISTGRADITDCNLHNITGTEIQIKTLITDETNLQDIFENIRPQDRDKFYNRIQNEKRVVVNLQNPVESDTIYTTSKRYSSTNLAQHLIGYLDLDENGIAGIERAYNDKLKNNGEKITISFNVNGHGDIYGDVKSNSQGDGSVLRLTIDNAFQRLAESIAKEYIPNGSIVIMESKTGKIKAMASTPVYDANNVVNYLQSENSPLVNKAVQAYEPGSVIKPLWAAAFLEAGASKDKVYQCVGYTEVSDHIYHCANDRAHGEVNMEKALIQSCNCYFIDRFIEDKGFVYKQTANQVNFGKSLELCNDYYTSAGHFPTAEQLINKGILSSVSFGQGDFLVTPVHIAAYMNIFANNGAYIYPQIVQGIYNINTGEETEKIYRYNARKVFSDSTSETVKDMLIQVVEKGNGGRAMPEYLGAGGKTGTSQTGKLNKSGEEIFTAWFRGFYPADSPRYTICITMYDGGESSYSAAPVFKKVCDRLYYLEYAEDEYADYK